MPAAALAAIFVTSFGVGFTGALMPGPLTTLTVRESMHRGFWAGPLLAAGHSLIELALVVGLALGLSRLLVGDPVKASVSIAGGLFLLWMGAYIVSRPPEQPAAIGDPPLANNPAAAANDNPWRRRWLHSLTAGPAASKSLPRMAAVLMSAAILVNVFNPGWVATSWPRAWSWFLDHRIGEIWRNDWQPARVSCYYAQPWH